MALSLGRCSYSCGATLGDAGGVWRGLGLNGRMQVRPGCAGCPYVLGVLMWQGLKNVMMRRTCCDLCFQAKECYEFDSLPYVAELLWCGGWSFSLTILPVCSLDFGVLEVLKFF